MAIRVERGSLGSPGGVIRITDDGVVLVVDWDTSPEYEMKLREVAHRVSEDLDGSAGPGVEPEAAPIVLAPVLAARSGRRAGLLAVAAASIAVAIAVAAWPASPRPMQAHGGVDTAIPAPEEPTIVLPPLLPPPPGPPPSGRPTRATVELVVPTRPDAPPALRRTATPRTTVAPPATTAAVVVTDTPAAAGTSCLTCWLMHVLMG